MLFWMFAALSGTRMDLLHFQVERNQRANRFVFTIRRVFPADPEFSLRAFRKPAAD